MRSKNVFIIHSSKDKKIGELLYSTLIKMSNGALNESNVFYSSKFRNSNDLGKNFFDLSRKRMQESDVVILLISKNLYQSYYCLQEMGAAWFSNKLLLPIAIDNSFVDNIGFLQLQVAIAWNNGINNSKQILEYLNKNLDIEFNDYNLALLENIRKYIETSYQKFNIENTVNLCETENEKKRVKKILSALNKNIYQTDSLEDRLNFIFNSKIFLKALFDSCGTNFCYNLVVIKMASVLLYYLYTRDNRISYSLLLKVMNSVNLSRTFLPKDIILEGLKTVKNTSDDEILAKTLIANIIENGYVTHALNPVYLDYVKKNGLGSELNNKDENILNILENTIYKNKFSFRQKDAKYYYSFPGVNSMHYACALSPEKLSGGPLKFLSKSGDFDSDPSIFDMVPITVGEDIKNYYKKVGYRNISIVLDGKRHNILSLKRLFKQKMKKLVKNYCFNYSYLMLIPIKQKGGDILDANADTIITTNNSQNFVDYIKNNAYGIGIDFEHISNFDDAYNLLGCITPNNIGTDDESLMSNLCSLQIKNITADTLIIKIPLYYKILQEYCKRNFTIGTKVITELTPYMKDSLFKVVKYKNFKKFRNFLTVYQKEKKWNLNTNR